MQFGLFASVLLAGGLALDRMAKRPSAPVQELNVERLNIVEADGRIRMVLANGQRQADAIVEGTVIVPGHQRPAGLIFFNEEGSELGGLVYSGRTVDGQTQAIGGLTFDRYNQDQTVQMHYAENGASYLAGVRVIDRPATSLAPVADLSERRQATTDPAARAELERQMMERMGIAAERMFVGRTPDNRASLVLSDSQSRARLVLSVDSEGSARVQFLDEDGTVVRELTP